MKIKNKGKVYPSPPPLPSPSSNGDYLSVLTLLPAAILALATVLSLEDREVLAYLITRSIKTTSTSSFSSSSSSIIQRKASKKAAATATNHKPPVFDCDCFDCYTSYWFRWDSSPNRELIHQAIEAFEDHLTNGETTSDMSSKSNNKKNGKSKRSDKTTRRLSDNNNTNNNNNKQLLVVQETKEMNSVVTPAPETLPENIADVAPETSPEIEAQRLSENEMVVEFSGQSISVEDEEHAAVTLPSPAAASSSSSHKGLARKVLPDVLGLFNSRLWSLWSPSA